MKLINLLTLLLVVPFLGCSTLDKLATPANEKTLSRGEYLDKHPEEQSPAVAQQNTKKREEPGELDIQRRVLILRFINKSPYTDEALQEAVGDEVAATISGQGNFVIVREKDLPPTNFISPGTQSYDMREVLHQARMRGIAGVIGGSIEDVVSADTGDEVGIFRTRNFRVRATLSVHLHDVHTERELFRKMETAEVEEQRTQILTDRAPQSLDSGRVENAVRKSLRTALEPISGYLRKLDWAGRIAKVDLHRYYINAGESTGIRRGQLLKVYGEGQVIRDSKSGDSLGVAPGFFKGFLKVINYFGSDGAIAVVHSGGGFHENDRVEIFTPPHEN